MAQPVGMVHVGPFTFQSSRYLLGALTLVPVILLSDSRKKKAGTYREMTQAEKKTLIKGGLACGVVMTFAASFQQVGLAYTTVGKSGFITSMYIILVPVFGLFFHKKVPAKIWGCVVVAAVGFYFLSINGPLVLSRGDTLTILCSLCFCFHILCVDHFVSSTDAIKLSFIQLLTTGVLSGIVMFLFEHPTWSAIQGALPAILYAGILSSGVGYTLQIVGQKGVNPTIASLILSLESVMSVLAGWLFLHQGMSGREILGCVLMFVAIILAQLPERKKAEKQTA